MSARCIKCVGLGEHGPCDEHSSFAPQVRPAPDLPVAFSINGVNIVLERVQLDAVEAAIAAAKAEAWKRAIGWVDYYLAMKLHGAARGGFEDLRKRMAHEAEHGPSTSVPMDSDHLKPGAGK